MKLIFYILFFFSITCKSQIDFPKLTFDDKAKHFYVAAGSAFVVGEIVYQTTNLEGLSSLVGAAFGISITLAKEYIIDKYYNKGVFSIGDIIAGCMGAFAGAMLHRIFIDLRYKHNQSEIIRLSNSKRFLD